MTGPDTRDGSRSHGTTPLRSKHRIAELLVAQIESGAYAVGDQLPSIREIRAEFGVAVDTARDAIRLLQQQGRVHVRARRGVFVIDPITPLPPDMQLKQVLRDVRDMQEQLREVRRALVELDDQLEGLADRLGAVK